MRALAAAALVAIALVVASSSNADLGRHGLYADRCCTHTANVHASYNAATKTVTVSWGVPTETNLGRDEKNDEVACQIYGGYTLSSGVIGDRSDIQWESPCFASASGITKQIDFEKDFYVQIAFICATGDGRWPYIPPPTPSQCGPAVSWYDNVWSDPVLVKVSKQPAGPTGPTSGNGTHTTGVAAYTGTYVGRVAYVVTVPPHGSTPKTTVQRFKQLRFVVAGGRISAAGITGTVGAGGSARGTFSLPGWTCVYAGVFSPGAGSSVSATGRVLSCTGGLKGTTVTGTIVARRVSR